MSVRRSCRGWPRLSPSAGGVYALEQIAEVAPHYRGHVAALLASFVRLQAPWPPSRPMREVDAERRRYHGGLRDDIGGALAALGRRAMIPSGVGIELEKVDLRGADLAWAAPEQVLLRRFQP
ncbi:hypothetical protein [Nonomuraea lactucae]|uniref:hypothetical protein n=1 Tax=Nonomuraea lactucae TaxID=2249762 RepID=UPI0013B474DF|nr:hypothetical protein [Nonomuraea lactucae]